MVFEDGGMVTEGRSSASSIDSHLDGEACHSSSALCGSRFFRSLACLKVPLANPTVTS